MGSTDVGVRIVVTSTGVSLIDDAGKKLQSFDRATVQASLGARKLESGAMGAARGLETAAKNAAKTTQALSVVSPEVGKLSGTLMDVGDAAEVAQAAMTSTGVGLAALAVAFVYTSSKVLELSNAYRDLADEEAALELSQARGAEMTAQQQKQYEEVAKALGKTAAEMRALAPDWRTLIELAGKDGNLARERAALLLKETTARTAARTGLQADIIAAADAAKAYERLRMQQIESAGVSGEVAKAVAEVTAAHVAERTEVDRVAAQTERLHKIRLEAAAAQADMLRAQDAAALKTATSMGYLTAEDFGTRLREQAAAMALIAEQAGGKATPAYQRLAAEMGETIKAGRVYHLEVPAALRETARDAEAAAIMAERLARSCEEAAEAGPKIGLGAEAMARGLAMATEQANAFNGELQKWLDSQAQISAVTSQYGVASEDKVAVDKGDPATARAIEQAKSMLKNAGPTDAIRGWLSELVQAMEGGDVGALEKIATAVRANATLIPGAVGQQWGGIADTIASLVATFKQATAASGVAGARALGGPVSAGRSYLVGERGPEVVTMGGHGAVSANSGFEAVVNELRQLRADMRRGGFGGGKTEVAVQLDKRTIAFAVAQQFARNDPDPSTVR